MAYSLVRVSDKNAANAAMAQAQVALCLPSIESLSKDVWSPVSGFEGAALTMFPIGLSHFPFSHLEFPPLFTQLAGMGKNNTEFYLHPDGVLVFCPLSLYNEETKKMLVQQLGNWADANTALPVGFNQLMRRLSNPTVEAAARVLFGAFEALGSASAPFITPLYYTSLCTLWNKAPFPGAFETLFSNDNDLARQFLRQRHHWASAKFKYERDPIEGNFEASDLFALWSDRNYLEEMSASNGLAVPRNGVHSLEGFRQYLWEQFEPQNFELPILFSEFLTIFNHPCAPSLLESKTNQQLQKVWMVAKEVKVKKGLVSLRLSDAAKSCAQNLLEYAISNPTLDVNVLRALKESHIPGALCMETPNSLLASVIGEAGLKSLSLEGSRAWMLSNSQREQLSEQVYLSYANAQQCFHPLGLRLFEREVALHLTLTIATHLRDLPNSQALPQWINRYAYLLSTLSSKDLILNILPLFVAQCSPFWSPGGKVSEPLKLVITNALLQKLFGLENSLLPQARFISTLLNGEMETQVRLWGLTQSS